MQELTQEQLQPQQNKTKQKTNEELVKIFSIEKDWMNCIFQHSYLKQNYKKTKEISIIISVSNRIKKGGTTTLYSIFNPKRPNRWRRLYIVHCTKQKRGQHQYQQQQQPTTLNCYFHTASLSSSVLTGISTINHIWDDFGYWLVVGMQSLLQLKCRNCTSVEMMLDHYWHWPR